MLMLLFCHKSDPNKSEITCVQVTKNVYSVGVRGRLRMIMFCCFLFIRRAFGADVVVHRLHLGLDS